MKLVKSSANPTTLVFDFVGGTNLDAAKDTHMHGGVVRILDADRMEADWSVFAQGKPSGSNTVLPRQEVGILLAPIETPRIDTSSRSDLGSVTELSSRAHPAVTMPCPGPPSTRGNRE